VAKANYKRVPFPTFLQRWSRKPSSWNDKV